MTKPTDEIRQFSPFSGPLSLLQFLSVVAMLGVGLSIVAHLLVA